MRCIVFGVQAFDRYKRSIDNLMRYIHARTASSFPWWFNCHDVRLSMVLGLGSIPGRGAIVTERDPVPSTILLPFLPLLTCEAPNARLIFKHIVSDLVAS